MPGACDLVGQAGFGQLPDRLDRAQETAGSACPVLPTVARRRCYGAGPRRSRSTAGSGRIRLLRPCHKSPGLPSGSWILPGSHRMSVKSPCHRGQVRPARTSARDTDSSRRGNARRRQTRHYAALPQPGCAHRVIAGASARATVMIRKPSAPATGMTQSNRCRGSLMGRAFR